MEPTALKQRHSVNTQQPVKGKNRPFPEEKGLPSLINAADPSSTKVSLGRGKEWTYLAGSAFTSSAAGCAASAIVCVVVCETSNPL